MSVRQGEHAALDKRCDVPRCGILGPHDHPTPSAPLTLCDCCWQAKPDVLLVHDEVDPDFTADLCGDCRTALGRG